jgi:hypothetical protein
MLLEHLIITVSILMPDSLISCTLFTQRLLYVF